jgi:hypothetical protein
LKGLELLTCHEVYLHEVTAELRYLHQLADIDDAATNALRSLIVDNADTRSDTSVTVPEFVPGAIWPS